MAKAAALQNPKPEEIISGKIDRIVFANPDNGYCVLRLAVGWDTVTGVGYMGAVRQDDEYEFKGEWKNHPKFGRQFQFSEATLILPTSREGLITYLCNAAFGIGPAKAGSIVDALGEDCLEKIQAGGPEMLAGVKGIKEEQAREIYEDLVGNRILADLTALICRQEITPRLAAKIFAKYGKDSLEIVKSNPYVLADEIERIGFKTADKIARNVGISEDSPFRIEAAVKYIITEAGNDGHCFLRPRQIMERLPEALGRGHGIGVDEVAAAVKSLQEKGRLIREGDCIYTSGMHREERELAGRVRRMVKQG